MANVELKPARVFEQFAKINAIPRPSKHEEKMIEYLKAFGQERGLETKVDETGNVIIRKPATPGMENKPCVILQSHMDMVCDKLVDVEIDFQNDPIQTYVDGEWLKAKGTTLGADDGIGCAIELALLDSDDIEHGPVECVFTVDEETGLTGAFGMKPGFMSGKYLINLDSEDEGQIFVSCAGGINTSAKYEFTREDAPEGYFFFEGSLKGLVGGHSGDDINKKRANAIKILARFLYMEQDKMDLRLAQWNSGKMHNAIPRDGKIVFCVPADKKEEVKADWKEQLAELRQILDEHRVQINTTVSDFIAIGEVGLDYYWSREFEHEQLQAFEEQVKWSVETRLPLMIHCRKAQNEMVHLLRSYEKELPGGVFHCFTGNQREAEELLSFDRFVLGVGGVSTFKSSHLREDLPAVVPLHRLVLETDSPYMAPVPHRGKRNESAYVVDVMRTLAAAYQVSEDELAAATNANVSRIFGCEVVKGL